MITKRISVGLAAIIFAVSAGAMADEIYKWIDEDGNVHYEDRPSGAESEEQLNISYSRTNAEALQTRVNASNEAELSRQEARAQADEDARVAEAERVEAEQQRADCAANRAKLTRMNNARRVYRTDEAGERVYLDDVQRAESIATAEALIRETCDT